MDGAEPLGHGESSRPASSASRPEDSGARGMLAFVVGEEAVFTGDTLFTGSVGGTQDAFDDLRRSVMDVLMGLPHELVVYPGHSERGSAASGTRIRSSARVARRRGGGRGALPRGRVEATLVVWSNDYDGGGKAWVRFRDGRDAIVGRLADHEVGVVFIASEEIQRYAEEHTTPPSELQRRLAEETRAELRSPQMLTGTVEGRLLEFLVIALRPQRVLELGTYSGYSAVSMAGVLPPGGHIDMCEVDETPHGGRPSVAWRRRARRSRHDPPRPGARDDRAARRRVRPDLHRRGQGQLPRVLRVAGSPPLGARPDGAGQHALVGAGRGGRRLSRRRRSPRSTTARLGPTWSRSCSPFVTA